MIDLTVKELVGKRPELEQLLKDWPAYLVGESRVAKIPMVGGGGGKGAIIAGDTGERIYVKFGRFDVGYGWGFRKSRGVVIVYDPGLFEDALDGRWSFHVGAEASAGDHSAEGSTSDISMGYEVFRVDTGGASATATARVVRVWPDKSLNRTLPPVDDAD